MSNSLDQDYYVARGKKVTGLKAGISMLPPVTKFNRENFLGSLQRRMELLLPRDRWNILRHRLHRYRTPLNRPGNCH